MANHYNHTILLTAIMGILLLSVAPWSDAAMGCDVVAQSLVPCLNYFESGGIGKVPQKCCDGIQGLNHNAQTTPDRQAACRCLKEFAGAATNINIGLAASIPTRCGIHLPYKLDPSTDCTKIH